MSKEMHDRVALITEVVIRDKNYLKVPQSSKQGITCFSCYFFDEDEVCPTVDKDGESCGQEEVRWKYGYIYEAVGDDDE